MNRTKMDDFKKAQHDLAEGIDSEEARTLKESDALYDKYRESIEEVALNLMLIDDLSGMLATVSSAIEFWCMNYGFNSDVVYKALYDVCKEDNV